MKTWLGINPGRVTAYTSLSPPPVQKESVLSLCPKGAAGCHFLGAEESYQSFQ